jgi:hypothetical protein
MLIDNSDGSVNDRITNMKVSDLKKMRDRAPFRAFQLHLTNGETLPVRHPEYLAVPPEAGTELFVVWVGIHWNLVDAGQVARVSLLNSKAGRQSSKSQVPTSK